MMVSKHGLVLLLILPLLVVAQPATGKETPGLKQANSMGGGEAPIMNKGKLRVFVMMGQSNMEGRGLAKELKPPYNKKHDRIRIWAHGRWEYFVPNQRFGPGMAMAHQLADFWPDDTIGIIKVAIGGTGIRAFEKDWSKERADRSGDAGKGPLYKDLMNAVEGAKKISSPEFCGFVWKQGYSDSGKKDLADEYYETFTRLISDVRTDLERPDLPVFILTKLKDEDLAAYSESKIGPQYAATVMGAQNRAGREIPNVSSAHYGYSHLPVHPQDRLHFNTEGQLKLGKIAADLVERYYKAAVPRR